MATNVDERIVSAKFDASDFEKGVNKTIKKLDELKKSLNITQVQKDVKELAEKTEASTDSMGKSLDKLSNRLTTFVGMVKQQILGSLASEVSSIFINMQHSITGFIRSISSDQVSAGMSKYQSMLTSVRQMVNAGFNEDKVFETLERTQTYADETSYSFEQMADAMSKMVAAGVDLEQAGKNVEGIANACANAGINASDASRAFYNLSQAYSSGKLHYTDYRSLELLNLTTEEFKEQMLEAAVAAGTLTKKTDKLGNTVYKTTNKKDKKVRANKTVNKKNLSEMLKYDWMNSEAMNYLFGKEYWMEVIDKDELAKLRKELGDEEFEKRFGKIASQAYNAAYEARSFVDVVNAIKDSVSSGWSKTFQNLFGKLTEAKDFFTDLANGPLAQVVYDIGEYRNAILGYWNSLDWEGKGLGGELFRQTILEISEALGILFHTFQQILPGFDEIGEEGDDKRQTLMNLGKSLQHTTGEIRDFAFHLKEAAQDFNKWMNSSIINGGATRIEILRQAFSNIGKVFTIIGRLAGIAFQGIFKALDILSPVVDGLIQVFEKLTEPLGAITKDTKAFKDIESSIDNILKVLEPVAKFLGQILGFAGEIVGFFAQMALDTVTSNIEFFSDALGLLMELITGKSSQMEKGEGILARIQADFEGIKQACMDGVGAIKEFFTALFDDLRKLFGLADKESKETEEGNGIFSGIIHFFDTNEFVQSAKAWIKQAFIDIGDYIKSIPNRVKEFGVNLYDTIRGMIFTEETRYNGSQLETKTILTPFGEWLDGVIKDVKEFIISIPQRIIDGVGTVTNWIDDIFKELLGEKPIKQANKTDAKDAKTDKKIAQFDEFIASVTSSVKEWFNDLPNKIQKALGNIGNFFSLLWDKIDQLLFGKKVKSVEFYKDSTGKQRARVVTKRIKSGFSKWFDGIIKEISKFIKNIPEYIKAGIKGAGDIVSAIVNAIFGKNENEQVSNKTIEEKIEAPFLGINLNSILEKIKDIGITLINQIARIFTGTDDVDKNMEWFSGKVAEGITWVKDKAKEALDKVLKFLVTLPTKIAAMFTGESKDSPEQGEIGKAVLGFGEAIGEFLTVTLPDKVLDFIHNAIEAFDSVWTQFYDSIIGSSEENANKAAEDSTKAISESAAKENPEPTAWQKFVEKLGTTIKEAFTKLPVWVAEGIELAVKALNDLIGGIGDWINSVNLEDEAKKFEEQMQGSTDTIADGANKAAENADGEGSDLWDAIKRIGASLFTIITKTIPETISAAFTWLGNKGSELWEGFNNIFSGGIPSEEKGLSAKSIGEKIGVFFKETLPKLISEKWSELKAFAKDVWSGVNYLFTGEIPKSERGLAIGNILTNIKKFIIDDIPKAISSLFAKKDVYDVDLTGLTDAEKAYVTRYVEALKKANHSDEKKEAENSFVSEIGQSILDAFKSLGPMILKGLAKAFDFLSDIGKIIIGIFSGDKSVADIVKDLFGKEEPEIRDAFTTIGESLKNFFINILPQAIGSAIGWLSAHASEWFSKLFTSMNKAKAEAEDQLEKEQTEEQKAADETDLQGAVTNVFDVIKAFIEGISHIVTDNGVGHIVMIFAIIGLLKALKNLFSISDELDSASRVLKWGAIIIAIAGLTSFLTGMIDLIKTGDDVNVNNAFTLLDKLGSLLEKLAWILGIFTAGKLISGLVELKSSSGGKIIGGNILTGFVGKLFDGLGNFFTIVGAGAGTAVAADLTASGIDSALSTISGTLSDFTYSLSEVLTLMDPMIEKLVGLNDRLDTAISSVSKIYTLFSEFYKSLAGLYVEASGNFTSLVDESGNVVDVSGGELKLSAEQYMSDLNASVEMYYRLAIFFDKFADALGKLPPKQTLETKIKQLTEFIGGTDFVHFMATMFGALEGAFLSANIVSSDFTSSNYDSLLGMAGALEILQNAMSVFANAVRGLDKTNVDAFQSTLDVFNNLAEAFSGSNAGGQNAFSIFANGDHTLSAVGREINAYGNYMKGFVDKIRELPGFDTKEMREKTKAQIDAVLDIAKSMAEAAYVFSASTTVTNLTTVAKELPGIGGYFGEFISNINRALTTNEIPIDNRRIKSMSTMLSSIGTLFDPLVMWATSSNPDMYDLDQIVQMLNAGLTGERGNQFAAALRGFLTDVSKALKDEDVLSVLDSTGPDIAKKILDTIQNAFDTDPDLKVKITPVLNMDEDTKAALRQQLGDSLTFDGSNLYANTVGANDQTEADNVKWSDLKASLDSIGTAIAAGPTNAVTVADMVNALTGVKVVIDKDELVGSITSSLDGNLGLLVWNVINNISNGP